MFFRSFLCVTTLALISSCTDAEIAADKPVVLSGIWKADSGVARPKLQVTDGICIFDTGYPDEKFQCSIKSVDKTAYHLSFKSWDGNEIHKIEVEGEHLYLTDFKYPDLKQRLVRIN